MLSHMTAVLAAIVAVFIDAGVAKSQDVPVMVSQQWLAARIRDPNLVVITVGLTRAAYDSSHIDGSPFLPYSADARTG